MEKTKFQKAVLIYKVYYLLYLLFAFNAFVNGHKILQYATYAAAGAGALLVLWMLKDARSCRKMKNIIILALFLLSYGLSSVLNMKYGVGENVQQMIWLGLQIFILYLLSYQYTSEMMKKELKVLAVTAILYCTIANIISLTMLKWGYLYDYVDPNGYAHGIGYRWGRLWGVYDDPNHGAVIAVIGIILAAYLWTQYKKAGIRLLLAFTIIIQYIYIGFADSRTASLALCAAVFTGVFLAVNCGLETWKRGKRYTCSVAAALVLAAVCLGGILGEEALNDSLGKRIQAEEQVQNHIVPQQANQDGRKKDLAKDKSNGRISIWKSGLEIAKTSPVYGVSFRNMTAYAKKNMPDTYIVNNPLVEYDSLHNVFVDVLASQGIIGMLLVLALIGNTGRILWKGLKTYKKEDRGLLITCASLIMAMATASMFYSYVFYLHAPQTYIFWLGLGYMISLAQKNEQRSEKSTAGK